MPKMLLDIWRDLSGCDTEPDTCLVNFYDDGAKMGMHQDRDEETFQASVLSLGDDCLFRVGGVERGGKTNRFKPRTGDAIRLSGFARLAYHGVSRIYPGTSALLKAEEWRADQSDTAAG